MNTINTEFNISKAVDSSLKDSSTSFTVNEIAKKVGGRVEKNEDFSKNLQEEKIFNIKPLSEAKKGDLTFFAPSDTKSHSRLLQLAKSSSATAIITKEPIKEFKSFQIIFDHPQKAILNLANNFIAKSSLTGGIHPSAEISNSASISSTASIGAYSVIGENVEIADNCKIFPHVVIYDNVKILKNTVIHSHSSIRENTEIAEDCIIQNGTTIGAAGFGYLPDNEKGHIHIPHIGSVKLEKEVEIGANSSIDKGTLGFTKIGAQTKIDNQVQVGHNNQIGQRTLICGQVGIGGSCEIGNDVILAGCTGVADHVNIDNKVRTAGLTGISRDLLNSDTSSNIDYAGFPPSEVSTWRRQVISIKKLPALLKEFKKLIKRIEKLENRE